MSSGALDSESAQIVITGLGVTSAFGRGDGPLLKGLLAGRPAFGQAARFDTTRCRVTAAAELAGEPKLGVELSAVIEQACQRADLDPGDKAGADLLLALHTDQDAARDPAASDV